MELTEKLKAEIDSKNVYDLLYQVRFAPIGNELMQGESGTYWCKKLQEKREADPGDYVAASKEMGWAAPSMPKAW